MEVLQEIEGGETLDVEGVGTVGVDVVAVILDGVSVQLDVALNAHVVISVVEARPP